MGACSSADVALPDPAPPERRVPLGSVKVSYIADEASAAEGGPLSWVMCFEGSCLAKFSFTVSYPNMHTLKEWQDFAVGRKGLHRMGNASWSGIDINESEITFGVEKDSEQDDMHTRFTIPLALVQDKLKAALWAAQVRGLEFKNEAEPASTIMALTPETPETPETPATPEFKNEAEPAPTIIASTPETPATPVTPETPDRELRPSRSMGEAIDKAMRAKRLEELMRGVRSA